MLSATCRNRASTVIPRLLKVHSEKQQQRDSVIDLATAENAFMKDKVLTAMTRRGLSDPELGYIKTIGGSLKIRKRISELFNDRICPTITVTESDIVLGAGAQCLLDALIESVCDPEDGVLIATPYWSGLDLSISIRNRAKVVPVNVPLNEAFSPAVVHYYETALRQASNTVKAVIVCNPNNPLGRCYPWETVEAIWRFCQRHELQYISDEVYALSIHDAQTASQDTGFTSALSIQSGSENVHVIYSLSKDFGCNGIRLGAMISRSHDVHMSVALSTHGQISSLTIPFAEAILSSEHIMTKVLGQSRQYLRDHADLVIGFCQAENIEFLPPSAGHFVFAKLCHDSTAAEEDLLERLRSAGVELSSGTSYHSTQRGWFRICFGLNRHTLIEGLDRVKGVLNITTQGLVLIEATEVWPDIKYSSLG
ncbi:1-aminocyclopropane-1-carboxylate synthase-like protein 1 [Lophiostoma macrostomum CBS 122681]|uniref:1-aminocyclopropane-1-carboxylate synthase-like protein 1 n=1 Tax=Lophiostoma macrostomum CBS 122681 TaxID=1314788 RepID=A0A6A6TCA2_9PLEO|nr:1-aminocyclopropane-1-carboxylate synthase-like protein 1 [Lophiostoma macrostomum CBS 122681]